MPQYMKKASKECVGPSCKGCSSGNCMFKGGKVHEKDSYLRPQSKEHGTYTDEDGTLRELEHDEEEEEEAGKEHLAKGGAISGEMHMEDPDHDGDKEIHGMLGEELLGAIERKDKKAILECIEACVMNCKDKG